MFTSSSVSDGAFAMSVIIKVGSQQVADFTSEIGEKK